MRRIGLAAVIVSLACTLLSAAFAGGRVATGRAKTVEEVIARNVKARGGLDAWRKVDTMMWFGHLERGDRKGTAFVPFVMQLQRPNRTRFEIKERFDSYARIFNGDHGWRVRPGNNGQPNVKSFSKEEVEFSRDEDAIGSPLIDYKAKGVNASLDGIDTVDGHAAYRLSLSLPSGAQRKVWIDVDSNLELRYDRPATNPLAPGKPVSTVYGGYITVGGLKVPSSLIVSSAPNSNLRESGDRLVIERVLVNPKLDAQAFLPPPMPMHRGGKILIPSDGLPTGTRPPSGP